MTTKRTRNAPDLFVAEDSAAHNGRKALGAHSKNSKAPTRTSSKAEPSKRPKKGIISSDLQGLKVRTPNGWDGYVASVGAEHYMVGQPWTTYDLYTPQVKLDGLPAC